MPCYHPLQASFSLREDGKKNIMFSVSDLLGKGFNCENSLLIPCGNCIGCRLERSRQWAVRCVHESQLYEDNCFITLTFSPQGLQKMCPDGSLSRVHVQNFMKRLRRKFSDIRIRVFYCGEYGSKVDELGNHLGRPHYHLILFNFDFFDKQYWKSVNGCRYYTSDVLSDLWSDPDTRESYGFCTIGDVTFQSAAYVARYCTKKINGDLADDHYKKVLPSGELITVKPEFAQPSLKPGIAFDWFQQFGMTDIFPRDECVIRGAKCKPPRYYDKLLERTDPVLFEQIKQLRIDRAKEKEEDNTFERLLAKERCQEARIKLLVRNMEAV